MIDPVRTGPASAVIATASARTGEAASQSNVVRLQAARAATAASSPALPRLLDLAADLAKAGPPVDHARVAQLRTALADGSYHVDTDALAKAMLRYEDAE